MKVNEVERKPTNERPQVYLQGNQYVDYPSEAIWSVYLSEAERHDRALIAGWRSDMDAILIFAGLFSAVVTAFIIESYKTLKRDPGDVTITLLAQISSQLANGTNTIISSPTPDKVVFEPPASALRVNVLWFLSLTFSLACALVATLVQQWSRNYLDVAQRRPRLYQRARIRSYLHEGLKTFGMSTAVKTIPTLLHISLFLFFGGLFEFLRPVNPAISYMALGILLVCGSLYVGTAIMSTVSHNCPYRIPISGVFWRMLKLSRWVYHHFYTRREDYLTSNSTKLPGNIVEEVELLSMKEHFRRDLSAIQWTLASLTDDTELEPFVEGIQGFLVSRDMAQKDAAAILIEIFINEEFDLARRIARLLNSCDRIPEPSQRQKRRVACLSALWTFASLSVTHKNHRIALLYSSILGDQQPVWLISSTIEAHWARCLGALLSCMLLSDEHQIDSDANHWQWLGLLAFLSTIPSLNSLCLQLRTDQHRLTSSEYRILALTGFLIAPVESPFDPIDISQHPQHEHSFYQPLLNVATHQLTMAGVRPQIQLAFAGAVSKNLKHSHAWHVFDVFFNALGPLIDGLDDPAAMQVAVAGMEGYTLAGKWMPSYAQSHVTNLQVKLESGASGDIGQPHEFADENENKQRHDWGDYLKREHDVGPSVKETEERTGAREQDVSKEGGIH